MKKSFGVLLFFALTAFAVSLEKGFSLAEIPELKPRAQKDLGECGQGCQALFDPSLNILTIKGQSATMKDYTDEIPPWKDPSRIGIDQVEEVIIEHGIKSIGANAFRDMTTISSVRIDKSVLTIGELAFSGCSGLSNLELNTAGNLEDIGERAFYQTGLITLTIPNSVITIGSSAFRNCPNLLCVSIGADRSDLEKLGGYVFKGCSKLSSVSFSGEKDVKFDNTVPPFDKKGETDLKEIRVQKTYKSNTFAGSDIKKSSDLKCGTISEERDAHIKQVVEDIITVSEKVAALVVAVIGAALAILDLVIALCTCCDK